MYSHSNFNRSMHHSYDFLDDTEGCFIVLGQRKFIFQTKYLNSAINLYTAIQLALRDMRSFVFVSHDTTVSIIAALNSFSDDLRQQHASPRHNAFVFDAWFGSQAHHHGAVIQKSSILRSHILVLDAARLYSTWWKEFLCVLSCDEEQVSRRLLKIQRAFAKSPPFFKRYVIRVRFDTM